MGLLSKIFGGNNTRTSNQSGSSTAVTVRNTSLRDKHDYLAIHPDIRDYLWIGDGKYKNYVPTPPKKTTIPVQGISLSIAFGAAEEPSLIYMGLPIGNAMGPVDRPPYYPTYSGLTPAQRGIYWKLLANPYDSSIDIGYVFVLYYGLERYLLTDKYEQVIDVILKLRDVHSNKSFQMYTANAVILTCLHRQRADIVQKFMKSLDKEHEYSFSPNLFLLCKYALAMPLTAPEVMRMAKAFEFTKNNYIKNYPDLFLSTLSQNIIDRFQSDSIAWSNLFSDSEFKKLPNDEIPIFANVSIMDKTIKVPSLLSSFKFRRTVYDLIDKTHEDVKKQLAAMKKSGEVAQKSGRKNADAKPKEVLSFDPVTERDLLNVYNQAKNNSLDQHFASIALQDFYYKYRSLDRMYLDKCVSYCKDDISRLPDIQRVYIDEERKKISSQLWLSQEEKRKEISEIQPFYATIPAFKRLAIIYEKDKDYDSAISICDQAISYYVEGDLQTLVSEFTDRRQKLVNKR